MVAQTKFVHFELVWIQLLVGFFGASFEELIVCNIFWIFFCKGLFLYDIMVIKVLIIRESKEQSRVSKILNPRVTTLPLNKCMGGSFASQPYIQTKTYFREG